MAQERLVTHAGGCHCGRVRFEVRAPAKLRVLDCNCSICTRSGYLHLFCSTCGVKSFYIPRGDPGSRSVNARCLDPGTALGMEIVPFNGLEWGRRRYTP